MPRKGENIYKRKDGRWEGRYIGCYDENHKAKYVYIYGKTYTEVKQKLAIERGRQKQHVPAEKKQITYGEVLDLWLHSTKTSIKESTYARYAHLINSHIKPQLGDYKLSMLSTEIIEDFIENQLVEGQLDRTGGLAPKTVIDLLAIVKSTIGYAQYKGFPVICNLSRLSVKRKDKEMRVLTPSERESLIGILMEDMDSFKFGVFLALYTGIRIGTKIVPGRFCTRFHINSFHCIVNFHISLLNTELNYLSLNSNNSSPYISGEESMIFVCVA